jgi:hypothetical protein
MQDREKVIQFLGREDVPAEPTWFAGLPEADETETVNEVDEDGTEI